MKNVGDEPSQSNEWWVETLLNSARTTNGTAGEKCEVTKNVLSEAGKKLSDVCELLLKAHDSNMECGVAIEDTKQALVGTAYYWSCVVPMVKQHRRAAAGTAFSVCGLVAAAIFWPTGQVQAHPATCPTETLVAEVKAEVKPPVSRKPETVEQMLIDGELERAWVTACGMWDGPVKWFWQGEVKRGMGEENAAVVYYQKAANAGHKLSYLALKVSGKCRKAG